jgi:hypothetical protein
MRGRLAVAAALGVALCAGTAAAQDARNEAHLVLTAEHEGMTYYVETAEGRAGWDSSTPTTGRDTEFVRLCTAPCEAVVPARGYLFTVARFAHGRQDADFLRLTPGRHTLRAHYESRQVVRAISATAQIALAVAAFTWISIEVALTPDPLATNPPGVVPIVMLLVALALTPVTVLRDDAWVAVVS